MLKSFVFTHCAVESRSNNLYFKRWFILCRLVMWQIENAVKDVLALDIDSGFRCKGGPCTCPFTIWTGHFPPSGLTSHRKSCQASYCSRSISVDSAEAERACPSAGDNGLLLVCFQLPNIPCSLYDNVQYRMSSFLRSRPLGSKRCVRFREGESLQA